MKGKDTILIIAGIDLVPHAKPIKIDSNPWTISTMLNSVKSCSLCRHAATPMTQDPCKTCWAALPKGSYPSYVARNLQTQGGIVPEGTWQFFGENSKPIVIGASTEPPKCECEVWINNCSCGRFEWDEEQKKK